jgi:hypothetical protein
LICRAIIIVPFLMQVMSGLIVIENVLAWPNVNALITKAFHCQREIVQIARFLLWSRWSQKSCSIERPLLYVSAHSTQ